MDAETTTAEVPSDADLASIRDRQPIAGHLNAVARMIHRSALRIYPAAAGLSFVDAAVIGGIGTAGPVTASDLAQKLTMHEGHLSRTLKALEGAGYVARLKDPADSRRKVLMLTKSGRSLYDIVIAVQRRRESELLAGISEKDRDAFFRTLRSIHENAESMLAAVSGEND